MSVVPGTIEETPARTGILRGHDRTSKEFDMTYSTCKIDGCDKPRKIKSTMCSMHAARKWRHGATGVRLIPEKNEGTARTMASHGYKVMRRPDHPLATPLSRGLIYEHRFNLFEKIGPGPHACAWCGCVVDWWGREGVKLTVDHLDADHANNDVDNLVPSCHPCNARRGQETRRLRSMGRV